MEYWLTTPDDARSYDDIWWYLIPEPEQGDEPLDITEEEVGEARDIRHALWYAYCDALPPGRIIITGNDRPLHVAVEMEEED